MKILVTCGSKRGGTEGIAHIIGETLRGEGHAVDVLPPREAGKCCGYDAVIVGGALYANRWHPDARRFVSRHVADLRRVPVWFFSSGPLDDSADHEVVAPLDQVAVLMERVGAQGHVLFGGRLAPDARGFPAGAMAKTKSGDWRHPSRVREWASEIAHALPTARPGLPVPQPARSLWRLGLHGLVGWSASAAALGLLAELAPAATAVRVLVAPLLFALVARHYFGARGAREPLPTALFFAAQTALLDLAVFATLVPSPPTFTRLGTWISYSLIALATWAMGLIATVIRPLAATKEGSHYHGQHRSSQAQ